MKKVMISTLLIALQVMAVAQQSDTARNSGIGGFLKKVNSVLNTKSGSAGTSLSTSDIVSGLKDALTVGAQNSTSKLSATDGFFKDAVVKILMPEQVRNVETKMRALGMGKLFDQAEASMNRAAEDASKSATPIFINAIKKMSITDALGILRGTDTAATSYLKRTTSNDLTTAFMPVIQNSLKKVNATKYWKDVFSVYNKFSSTPVTYSRWSPYHYKHKSMLILTSMSLTGR